MAAVPVSAYTDEDLKRAAARWDLIDYAKRMVPSYRVEPFHQLIADRLTAVANGAIDRLMIEMPPRHGKSELGSVLFPSWYLGNNPDDRIIQVSYADTLASSFSGRARNLMDDERYPFPGVKLAEDSKAKDQWNVRGRKGGVVAAGIGGSITGRGGNIIIIDDPVKDRQAASSETVRRTTWEWYQGTLYSRLEAGRSAIVLILTRWHEDDLAGRLLKEAEQGGDQWEVLRLPAIAEENSPDGRQPGEALWPARYPVTRLERIRTAIGLLDFESLYQQNPRSPEGAMFKRDWFTRIISATELAKLQEPDPDDESTKNRRPLEWTRYWDLAVSVKTSADYTASAAIAFGPDSTMYIRDMIRGKWEWPEAKKIIKQTMRSEPRTRHIIEEALHGTAALQELRKDPDVQGVPLRGYKPDTDKVLRASAWSSRAESGNVVLVRGTWIASFLDEVLSFPLGAHDDQVDSVSGAVASLGRGGVGLRWL